MTHEEIRAKFGSLTKAEKSAVLTDLKADEDNKITINKSIKFSNRTFVHETVVLDKDYKFVVSHTEEKVISDKDFLTISTITDKL